MKKYELSKITLHRTPVLHSSLYVVRLKIAWITKIFNWLPVSFVSVLRPCRSWGRFQAIGLCQGSGCNRQAPVLSSLWSNGKVDLGSQGRRSLCLLTCLVLLQCGQNVFEMMRSAFDLINVSTSDTPAGLTMLSWIWDGLKIESKKMFNQKMIYDNSAFERWGQPW